MLFAVTTINFADRAARAFATPLPPAEMDRLRQQYAGQTIAMASFFARHRDDGGWPA